MGSDLSNARRRHLKFSSCCLHSRQIVVLILFYVECMALPQNPPRIVLMHKIRIVYLSCIAIAHQKTSFCLVRFSLIFPPPKFTALLVSLQQAGLIQSIR